MKEESQIEIQLRVDRETLERAGLKRMWVQYTVAENDLAEAIHIIRSEPCVHTWKNLPERGPQQSYLDIVKRFEENRRPTRFLFLYGLDKSGRKVLVGLGTYATKISHAFEFQGFGVIARCYIHPNYRSFRLYYPFLQLRFELCRQELGDDLIGIHLGSSNPRIFNAIKNCSTFLPFFYVGDEALPTGKTVETVRDFLWLAEPFKSDMISEVQKCSRLQASQKSMFLDFYKKMFSNEWESDTFYRFIAAMRKNQIDFNDMNHLGLFKSFQLFRFLRAIPLSEKVTRDNENSTAMEETPPFSGRKAS